MRKHPLRSNQPSAANYVPVHGRLPGQEHGGESPAMAAAFADGEESFAELFEASLKSPKKAIARRDPELGEVVQGEVVQIGNEFAFLDIGAKAEAMLLLEELRGENGELTIQLGDKLEGHVVSVGGKEGGIIISGKLQRGAGLRDQLRLAFEQGIPVEGLVTGVNKGGLDIDLGGVRAFLPVSQIELRYCQDPSSYVGRAMTLKVTRYDEDARNVVVSRRSILEVEQRAMALQTREKLIPGTVFNGIVTSVRDYGAFVDIGGLEGLVHVSELGYGRALRPDEVVKPGQRVEVVVLKVEPDATDREQLKVALSLKALMADPMDEMLGTLTEGQRVTGKVVRLEPFGAFVQLQPGVEGLIHISAMAERHVTHPREVVTLGQEIAVTVISLDRERRRIGLSLVEEMRAAQAAAAASLATGEVVMVAVERVEPHGVVVKVVRRSIAADAPAGPKAETPPPKGTIANAELNVPRGSDIKRLFPEGKEFKALIQSIEPDGKIRLSVRAAEMAEEKASLASYSGASAQAAGKATMEEMLRSKLGAAVGASAGESVLPPIGKDGKDGQAAKADGQDKTQDKDKSKAKAKAKSAPKEPATAAKSTKTAKTAAAKAAAAPENAGANAEAAEAKPATASAPAPAPAPAKDKPAAAASEPKAKTPPKSKAKTAPKT